MDRSARIKAIQKKLDRPIVWYGPRGTDAVGLNVFPDHFVGSFSFYDKFPYQWDDKDKHNFISMEEFTRRRKLSREFGELPEDNRGEQEFLNRFSKCLEETKPYLVSYSNDAVLEAAVTKSRDAILLGNDFQTFSRMCMKPRIEKDLVKRGIPIIPWDILTNVEQVDPYFDNHRAVVVRPQSGSSGAGIMKLHAGEFSDEERNIVRAMLADPTSVVSIAPYLPNAVSLNMSGVVYRPQSSNKPANVSRFPCSAQIIGAPSLTDLPFGYCGNDFAYGYSLDDNILDECDRVVRLVGEYLGTTDYVGVFGVDLMVTQEGDVLFTEVNPRFQGSTRILTRMTSTANMADAHVEHLAATLGVKFGGTLTAREWTENKFQPWSQMYLHAQSVDRIATINHNPKPLPGMFDTNERSRSNTPANQNVLREMAAKPFIKIEPGSVVERISFRGGATLDGVVLSDRAQKLVSSAKANYMTYEQPALTRGLEK